MEELTAGVRELHQRVGHLDDLLRERDVTTDLSEKLSAAAHDVAEQNTRRIRLLWIVGTVVALLWTPMTAWGAMWMHERVRNTCLPSVLLVEYVGGDREPNLDRNEPWYCGIFPGTNHPREDRHVPSE
jgi:hypothetical protein